MLSLLRVAELGLFSVEVGGHKQKLTVLKFITLLYLPIQNPGFIGYAVGRRSLIHLLFYFFYVKLWVFESFHGNNIYAHSQNDYNALVLVFSVR